MLTEICKMDPNFDKELFIRDCRDDIIPNVLEAILRGDLEILEDWCHEAVSMNIEFNFLIQWLTHRFLQCYPSSISHLFSL